MGLHVDLEDLAPVCVAEAHGQAGDVAPLVVHEEAHVGGQLEDQLEHGVLRGLADPVQEVVLP